MKRICLALLFFVPSFAKAAIVDPLVMQEKTVMVRLSTTVPVNANPSTFLLVSLSTPTIFPHAKVIATAPTINGEVDINNINIVVDKLAASSGTVKIGVVNFVNNSTGSVTFFYSKEFSKNASNTDIGAFGNGTPSFVRCKVIPSATQNRDGTTPFILTNDKRSGSSLYRSTETLALQQNSPVGLISPLRGDIVMEVVNSDATNTFNVTVDVWYHTEP